MMLTTESAAELLGVHTETIRRLARKGTIPAFKVGKDWRFRNDDLAQWIEDSSAVKKTSCLLVIDDDPSFVKLMRRYLEKEGYRVITALSGPEGLELIQYYTVHAVLLDLEMPIMNGPEIVSKLKNSNPDIPIIIVTGYPDSQLMMDVNHLCPLMLVSKPVDRHILLSAVRTTLHGASVQDRD